MCTCRWTCCRFAPIVRKCRICKCKAAQHAHYCNQCAYKKGVWLCIDTSRCGTDAHALYYVCLAQAFAPCAAAKCSTRRSSTCRRNGSRVNARGGSGRRVQSNPSSDSRRWRHEPQDESNTSCRHSTAEQVSTTRATIASGRASHATSRPTTQAPRPIDCRLTEQTRDSSQGLHTLTGHRDV